MLFLVYGGLAFFIYYALVLNADSTSKVRVILGITAYGAIVQQVAVSVLDYRGQVHWIIESRWGFCRIINREVLLNRLLGDDFGVNLGLDFMYNKDSAGDFIAYYALLFLIASLILLGTGDRSQKMNVILLLVGAMLVDLSASLLNGWGAHDFNMVQFRSDGETLRLIGDIRDIFIHAAALCYILTEIKIARAKFIARRAGKVRRRSPTSLLGAVGDRTSSQTDRQRSGSF